MTTAPEATGQETPITKQPGSLDAILQSLGLDQLNPPTPTGHSENIELKGLTQAIEALAQDVASKLETLGERLNALESWPLALQVQNSQGATSFSTSTEDPACCRSLVNHRTANPMARSGYCDQRDPWMRCQITNKCSPGMTRRMTTPHQLIASARLLQEGRSQHH